MTDRLASGRTQPRSALVAALRAARAARRAGQNEIQSASPAPQAPHACAEGPGCEAVPAATAATEASPPSRSGMAEAKRTRLRRWRAQRRSSAASSAAVSARAPAAGSRGDRLTTAAASARELPEAAIPRCVTSIPETNAAPSDPPFVTVKVAGSLFAGLIDATAPTGLEAPETRADATVGLPAIPAARSDVDASARSAARIAAATDASGEGDDLAAEQAAATQRADREGEIALTVIPGLGPGVSLRLARLGYRTIADLSAADPELLRRALGEISRLLDVEQWIAHARALAADQRRG